MSSFESAPRITPFLWFDANAEEAVTAGGSESQCGGLKDEFGLSWQTVPASISELVRHPHAMQAMMKMKKPDIAELERAAKE